MSSNHQEQIHFHILEQPGLPLILGFPWLQQNNHHIDWKMGVIQEWGSTCHTDCLRQAVVPPALTGEHLEPSNLAGVTSEYHELRQVFRKTRTAALPPHWLYDCAIDLLQGNSPPKGRLYLLSEPERQAIEEYICKSLAAGIIRLSSAPAEAGFFFVEKKDKSLSPCIDYRGLKDIMIKNRYPLPLISSAFKILQGAKIFSKLELRNAYHLVHIREGDE